MTIYDTTYKRIIIVTCQVPSTTAVLIAVCLIVVHPVVPARREPEAKAPPITLGALRSTAGATAPHHWTQGRELDAGRPGWASLAMKPTCKLLDKYTFV
jgi:hypothetical protein